MGQESDNSHSMCHLIEKLFPICRSITGDGVRQTLNIIQDELKPNDLDLKINEVSSATQVLDWEVPQEWNIEDAYIKDSNGKRIVDFMQSNLHVVSYSQAFKGTLSFDELKPHLFTLPEQPDVIPYRTSYYNDSWGFCLSQNQFDAMQKKPNEAYEVCINSSKKDGSLSYGELYLAGRSTDEVLISCHICHPSLANDNLSGLSVAVYLAKYLTLNLAQQDRHFSYRFLFIPGTIGAITWLALNQKKCANIKHGLVLAGLGDKGELSYKRSRQQTSKIDMIASYVLSEISATPQLFDFSPYGYDERQYCSPGFNLPVGRLSRTPFGTFPEYHTSDDNLSFIDPKQLQGSLHACIKILDIVENDRYLLNNKPKGEPKLSKYGLYSSIGGLQQNAASQMAILWLLNYSDGKHSLLDIAIKSSIPFDELVPIAKVLVSKGLLATT